MKTLRYLLIVIGMVSVLGLYAQGLATKPEAQMQSTSGMVYSGSTLPQAAATGTYVTGTTVGTYSPAKVHPGHIRKGASSEDGEDTPPGDPEGPMQDPLGDVFWPLMLIAIAFSIWIAKTKPLR